MPHPKNIKDQRFIIQETQTSKLGTELAALKYCENLEENHLLKNFQFNFNICFLNLNISGDVARFWKKK